MTYQANQSRIQKIFQMLFEMATGNFTHRISVDETDDEISNIAKVLNTMAENMLKTINKSGNIIPVYTYQSLEQATFILNKEFQIESFSNSVTDLLGYKAEQLYKIHFSQIIGTTSQDIIKQICESVNEEENYFNTQQLSFKRANVGIVPYFCTFSALMDSDKIIVSVISTILNDYIDYTIPTVLALQQKNAAVIQQVYNYILKHLDRPLPNLKQLAKSVGTNPFTLKEGFRYYFNTSIYHFYNEERLKKAHELLKQSIYSVKVVGIMTGFKDYPTFYKAFKKRFGYAPSELGGKEMYKDV